MTVDDDDLLRLFSSASLVLAGTIFASVSKLVERVVVARWLSAGAFGEVSLALAVVQFGVTFGLLGLNKGIPRFVSRYEADRDVRGVWLSGLVITGVVSVLVAAVAFVFDIGVVTDPFFERSSSDTLLRLYLLGLPFVIGMTVAIGTIRGLEHTIYKTYTQDLCYPVARIVLLVGLLSAGFGIHAAGLSYLLASILAFVAAHVLLDRLVRLAGAVRFHGRELVAFSAPLIVATVLSRLLTWTDTLMLGFFRSSREVGLYSAAYPLATSLVLMFGAFGFMYLPLTSRLDAEDEHDEIDRVFTLTTKWILIGTFPAFLVLTVFSDDVLGVLYGPTYTPAATALTVLAVGFFTHAAAGRNRETISALGYTKYVFLSNVVGFACNVVLNLVLIPRFGMVGAAVASASSYCLLNCFVNAVLKLRFGISSFSGPVVRTVVLLPLVVVPPAVAVSNWVTLTVYTVPVALVAGGVATVAVVSLGGGLQAEDRVVIEFVEDLVGRPVPVVHRYLPETPAPEE
ncbi:flippase (plasmid) [Halorientalis pallida]|uniref:flippase n=1 Tax=Halorientalis pallida TaxID=2479928 RepID=UPI003C7014A2